MDITTENTFETAIIQSLVENGGYTEGNASDYSPELGLFKYEVLSFSSFNIQYSIFSIQKCWSSPYWSSSIK